MASAFSGLGEGGRRMSPRQRAWLAGSALAALALLVQLPFHDRALVPMDEGHLAAAAGWMLDGKLLYRDIHTGIFPGIYLLTTVLFGIFGRDLIVTRWAAVVMNVVIVLCLWRLAARALRPHWALVAPALHLLLLAVAFPVLCMFNYSTLAVTFGLVALLCLLRHLETGHGRDAAWVGVFVAAATLTKQNFGALVFVSLLLVLLWHRRTSVLAERPLFTLLWPIAAAGLATTAVAALPFVTSGTLFDLVDSTVLSLGASQLQDFDNPIPPIFGAHPPNDGRFMFLYMPPILFNYLIHGETFLGVTVTPGLRSFAIRASYGIALGSLALGLLGLWRSRERGGPSERRARHALVLFAVLFFPGIFPSAIWSHLAFVLIPILLVVAFLGDALEQELASRPGAVAALRAATVAVGLFAVLCVGRIAVDVARWNSIPLDLPHASLRVSERQAGLFQAAARFVDTCAPDDAPIFVAPDMPALWFITGRPNPTRFDLTIPGNVDGAEIARRLEETHTPCVVFSPQMYPEFPPFTRLFPELARYLGSRYRKQEVIRGGDGEWWGLVRHSDAP